MQISSLLNHALAATAQKAASNSNTNAAASQSSSTGSSTSDTTPQSISSLNPGDFMTLLIAQIQAQDPTNPMDPTTFVNQLVSFNTLEQVMQINTTLNNYLNPPSSTTATGSTNSNTGSASATTSTSKVATN